MFDLAAGYDGHLDPGAAIHKLDGLDAQDALIFEVQSILEVPYVDGHVWGFH